jgi:hypothetical protein
VAREDPLEPEGPARALEYCVRAHPFRLRVPHRGSPGFIARVAKGLFDPMPVAVRRFPFSGNERISTRPDRARTL